VTVYPGSVDPT